MPALIRIEYDITGPTNTQILWMDFASRVRANVSLDQGTAPFLLKSHTLPNGQYPYMVFPPNQYVDIFVIGVPPPGVVVAEPITLNFQFTKLDSSTLMPIAGRPPTNATRVIDLDRTGKYFFHDRIAW